MQINILVTHNHKKHAISIEAGAFVSKALRQHKFLQLPCGGAGTCGKCLIYAQTVPHAEELKRLTPAALANGLRLACYTKAYEGLKLSIPHQRAAKVLTSFATMNYNYRPIVEKMSFTIRHATLENQQPDVENILELSGATDHQLNLEQQSRLPEFLLMNTTGYAVLQEDQLLSFGNESAHTLLAIDIGTTTVAGILLDLRTQAIIEACGELNSQAPFGADVISRIHNSLQGEGCDIGQLQHAIVQQISGIKNDLISKAAAKGVHISDPSAIALTGNTTMIHFLCGLPAENIGKAPFIPVTLAPLRLHARDLKINSQAPVFIMPGISAYVGADIVAALLAADAHNNNEPFLLIDFGTNAEIVLSDGKKLFACSTAAGPCFEGATLACGSVAEPGAIDSVFKNAEELSFTTIDQVTAKSICGSAVIDCIAELLEAGTIDETGRFSSEGSCSSALTRINEETIFPLTGDVYLSQADIRKVQLAKAAVRAGIETLLKEAQLDAGDLKTLFIAGGFGTALNPANAVRIGMIPKSMEALIRPLGNAAGSGVIRYMTELGAFESANDLKARTTYLELSCHPEFTNEYVMQMTFPAPEMKCNVVNY